MSVCLFDIYDAYFRQKFVNIQDANVKDLVLNTSPSARLVLLNLFYLKYPCHICKTLSRSPAEVFLILNFKKRSWSAIQGEMKNQL
jgi:hypothetical protein